jgi:long-chain acyl-CoA synthetase
MELPNLLDPLFEHAMIIGEARPYLSALVVLDPEEAKKAGSVSDKVAAARIAEQLKSFPGYAQVRRVAIVEGPWAVENGLLTPTLKLKRAPIVERYKAQVEDLYKGRERPQ